MNDYRANRVAGHSYFFTVRLSGRGGTLLTDHIAAFGEAIRQARGRKPFHVDAWVALPDHAHAIWTLPPGDHDCATRWRAVKIAFSKSLGKSGAGAGLDTIWEPHYQQHAVGAGADDYAVLVDYIHHNPLRHGLCAAPHEWQWSSLHRFIAAGMVAQSTPPVKSKRP
ncbi:REP-associated tyrosine transposase [Massilia aquatica]|uniref:Transposase n=1 Tax=Massilia aquatica TaxID=2609000 RepID=A0ABX0MFB0_9BURK|nr:transposase [Massilia aquatica]NHZ42184.1 transposase [Massilia aquatica]